MQPPARGEATPGPPAFRLEGVGKRYGHAVVLDGLSFDVPSGESVLLLGNNGAGKSTLLRILSTLMRPSAGLLRFRGAALPQAAQAARRELGMISHDPRLYGDLTARENLRVFGTLYGVAELAPAIAGALEEVRLEHVPDVPVRTFSSGMLKRLALARLLLQRPTVLLLDEPYSGLDQASVALFDAFLERFRRQGGTTLLVTHQFTPGVEGFTRVVILHGGSLVYNQSVTGLNAAACAALLRDHAGAPAQPARP
jgi:heme exporter protein A